MDKGEMADHLGSTLSPDLGNLGRLPEGGDVNVRTRKRNMRVRGWKTVLPEAMQRGPRARGRWERGAGRLRG